MTCSGSFTPDSLRHDWTVAEISALADMPFADLLYRAHSVHRSHFDPNELQLSTLLSIKTGGCPEDCGYCSQSVHHHASLPPEALLEPTQVIDAARRARDAGATRFCMGAAWRSPKDRQLESIAQMVRGVKQLGLETCLTLGMLTRAQAEHLKQSGLDYYNHNLDTSPEYYPEIITTRTYEDRLGTLEHVRAAGIHLCCGGILGMGETRADRVRLLQQLANLPRHPESVPINLLVRVEGTPLAGAPDLDPLEFVRTVALARILMPRSAIRLSAGRESMSDEAQALSFFAGANSVFFGERLLTTPNPASERDRSLFARLGIRAQSPATV
jgi:biotin synthase